MHALERTLSHGVVQHTLSPDEEPTFPQLTQAGSHTDAYLEESPSGLVLAREAEAPVVAHRHGSQSTLVSAPHHHGVAADPEKGGTAHGDGDKLVTWKVGDSENPRNFSRAKKWVQTLLPTLLCFVAGLSSSLITGGLPEMAEHYSVSEEVIVRPCLPPLPARPSCERRLTLSRSQTLTVCVFVVGFGLGPLLLSPLSESASLSSFFDGCSGRSSSGF